MCGSPLCVPLVVGETEGSGKYRQMVQAREFPDLLYISRNVLGTVIDLEAIVSQRCPPTSDWIEEPVGVHHVLARHSQNVPLARKNPLGRRDDLLSNLTRHVLADLRRRKGAEMCLRTR